MNNWFELLLYNGILPFLWVVPRGGRAHSPCSNHGTRKFAFLCIPRRFLYISTAKGCNRQDNDSRWVVHRSCSQATNISSLRFSQILSLIDIRTEDGKSTHTGMGVKKCVRIALQQIPTLRKTKTAHCCSLVVHTVQKFSLCIYGPENIFGCAYQNYWEAVNDVGVE